MLALEAHLIQKDGELVLSEMSQLQQTIEHFRPSERDDHFRNDPLEEGELWEKVGWIFSRGPDSYFSIVAHLTYGSQQEELDYFNGVVGGGSPEPPLCISSNHHKT